MRIILLIVCFLTANSVIAQQLSKGKMRLREAMEFQSKLSKGSTSLADVRDEWARAAKDPEVRKDNDALAIAYASRAIVERDLGHVETADSLFKLSMPLFELKASKAYFLVTHANLRRDAKDMPGALTIFTEIATEFDSLPQLNGITFYAKSGYADLAYAIDAARNITLIGYNNQSLKPKAIKALSDVLRAHPSDQLGLMAILGLEKLDDVGRAKHISKKEKLIAKRPEFETLAADFASELN
jgi:hypothetical protein